MLLHQALGVGGHGRREPAGALLCCDCTALLGCSARPLLASDCCYTHVAIIISECTQALDPRPYTSNPPKA